MPSSLVALAYRLVSGGEVVMGLSTLRVNIILLIEGNDSSRWFGKMYTCLKFASACLLFVMFKDEK